MLDSHLEPWSRHQFNVDISRCLPPRPAPLPLEPSKEGKVSAGTTLKYLKLSPGLGVYPPLRRGRKGSQDKAHGRCCDSSEPTLRSGRTHAAPRGKAPAALSGPCRAGCERARPPGRAGGYRGRAGGAAGGFGLAAGRDGVDAPRGSELESFFLRARREKPRGGSEEGGCSAPGGPSRVPAGEGTGQGGGWGGREAASSEPPLTRVSLVPAEWVWPGLTSRSSRPPT